MKITKWFQKKIYNTNFNLSHACRKDKAGKIHLFSGHSIEAGWFLLDLAIKKNKPDLVQTAIQTFMINPFNYGWDKEHGGIYYFLDVDGWSPVQLEWDLKLFWPHNEAMISFLMAYKHTKDTKHLDTFSKIFDYCYSHVSIVNKQIIT